VTAPTFDLSADGTLALDRLAERARPEDPFAPGAAFWEDPHVSERLLEAHLDPEREAASRPHDRIDDEVAWLVDALGLSSGDAVLDLGCGPGLYCERLHDRGLDVTGVDLSETALEHARRRAEETDRDVDYRRADYRRLDADREFDAAILVYFDFGTFGDGDRDAVLDAVRDALVPGGRFAFDVYAGARRAERTVGTEWECHDGPGFWRDGPHLVLGGTHAYPDRDAVLDQHVVVGADGEASVYRFPERHYDPADLRAVLTDRGFAVEGVRADLRGTPHAEGSESIGVVARADGNGSADGD
jgi:SAM-dependent methyltransferase